MLVLSKFFVENSQTPMIIRKNNNEIRYKNPSADYFLTKNNLGGVKNTSEIHPELARNIPQGNKPHEIEIILKKIKFRVTAYPVRYDDMENCILLQINENFTTADFDEILDTMGDAIAIFNRHTQMEKHNIVVRQLSDTHQTYIGETAQGLIDMGLLKKAACLKVFQTQTAQNMNVTYINGITLMYTSTPIFDRHGALKRVISTGRDITKLIDLEKRLAKTEKIKNEYLCKLKKYDTVDHIPQPVYASREMQSIINTCDKISAVDSSVFLNGETGVGKEVIARYIHENSHRKTKPFIPVNCGAIPENLFETELFGYEQGAFTGAQKGGKTGLFETANKGTIFLDEISELPQNMQSKLLRVIQEKKFNRVGNNNRISIDVRFISASNLYPEQLQDNTLFRQDLYYRLATIPINIPPLRERIKDIPPLTDYFLSLFNKKYTRNIKFHKDLVNSLLGHSWRGNIRELRNFIERVVILSDGDVVALKEFRALNKFSAIEDEAPDIAGHQIPLSQVVKKLENELITTACHNHQSIYKAAQALKIAPSTIYRKIKKGEILLES